MTPLPPGFVEENEPDRTLVRLWTEQLYREYDHILYTYRVRLRPAVIRIAELERQWGRWNPATRELALSRRLIQSYPWDVVIEILKHEMAHQWVDENAVSARPHGPEFAQACRTLGVADWAIAASGELPRTWQPSGTGGPGGALRATSPEEERLLQRVEKLLALAGSSNEHESLLAMQRVQQMYAKYNLERARRRLQADPAEMVYLRLSTRSKRTDAVQSMIGAILSEHFFVRVIYCRSFDAREASHYAAMEALGTRANVLMAEYVHGFLSRQTASLWETYRRAQGKPGRDRRSYVMGVLNGFSDKLRRLSEEEPAPAGGAVAAESRERRALMKRADQELEAFVALRHPRLVNRSWGAGRREPAAFAAGLQDGAALTLHRPLGSRAEKSGRLLGK
jgi:hypothetical protein